MALSRLGSLVDQAFDGGRSLGTHAFPVGQAILGNAQAFLAALGDRVVETDALDEAAIGARACRSRRC